MKRLMNFRWAAPAWLAGWLLASVSATGATALPLSYTHVHDGRAWNNYRSLAGLPLSATTNQPPGSNGHLPPSNESTGVFVPPTAGQFRGLVSFGAIPALPHPDQAAVAKSAALRAGSTPFNGMVAAEMRRPRAALAGTGMMILRRAQVAAPYLSRQVSFRFGAVVAPPARDERGVTLVSTPNTAYWLPEPHSTNGHAGAAYHWSPHSRQVYATQAGPLALTWRKATPYTAINPPPADYVNARGTVNFQTNGPNIFLLYTENYVVSGSAVKEPRKMYWTQKGFQNLGVPVTVPSTRVGAVNVVFNNNFPRTVPEEYVGVGSTSPTDGSTNSALQERRTLWFEKQLGSLFAYNAEGRVFVELLGDLRTDGQTYVPLATEIVDVIRQAIPEDVTVELGERIRPPDGGSVDTLYPQAVQHGVNGAFAFQHDRAGSDKPELYAVRETANLNDYLVHWTEEGEAGLRWPKLFGRYRMVWPTDVARYSHYLRPTAASEAAAAETAVVLEPENAPNIEYQDPLDRPRAKFTPEFRFYTWLDPQYPVHRTLLRYVSGDHIAFERVFSWLDANVRATNFVGPGIAGPAQAIATGLAAWDANAHRFNWPADLALSAPRVVSGSVEVGQRILPPPESAVAAGEGTLAGHINRPIGTAYDVTAYRDPLQVGFTEANRGAIIPVNAIPNQNRIEVWWFRTNAAAAGPNSGNRELGFRPVYWPSVIGDYTIRWPANPREIVLASKLGGTGLTPAEQLGRIYVQNVPTLDGYNPNEEHALMSGGTPFATRDDLNITTSTNGEYSSHPFVLLSYPHPDGRPAMSVFRVLREKPEAGWVFDYVVPAGQMLQPPPPLGFLAKPVEGTGDAAINYNTEPAGGDGDLPGGWTDAAAHGKYGHYRRFTYRDRKQEHWVYRGPHAGLPRLQAGTFHPESNTFTVLTEATAVVGQPFRLALHASRQTEYLSLTVAGAPAWLETDGLAVHGTPATGDVGTRPLDLVIRDLYDGALVTNRVTLRVSATGAVVAQAPLAIHSTNAYTGSVITYTDRAPFLAGSPGPSNSFTMRYYYRTEPSFAWPGVDHPPPAGSIVPYLRRQDPATGAYVGQPGAKETAALDIVYRPFWPVRDPKDSSKSVPTLPFGATLAEPGFELPGVRDFKTATLFYQQSIAADLGRAAHSAVLHDATRAKYVDVTREFPDQIPPGVNTEYYQGKFFFPNLPPHLVTRLFIDPNRGPKGSLGLTGEYRKETLGESYLHLNVLRGSDLVAVHDLCPRSDTDNHRRWTNLVNALATVVETFHEDLPQRPGTYVPNRAVSATVGVGELAVVENDNTAVDSYAVSATGPGSGYVTLLEASGTAFTQPGDPVAMHIFKVGGRLHRGELKVIPAPNPLNELITFQHSADLAGRFAEYEYEWKLAAPVDGFPPEPDATMSRFQSLTPIGPDVPRYTLGGAGIQALSDNYVVMRYRPINPLHPLFKAQPTDADWSEWTRPVLAEGWIKRVLAGINPFNQRVSDLFNNRVNTDASIITQAGRRWEGDVALNGDTINNYGLIEIYETVLRRGRALSVESGFNYGPANDALLLAAGYLNDLYMMVGNEAWADAANPTIGIGTADRTYGDIATSMFSFKGQVPSLLDEELSLLRGRDDFLQPGVEVTPVYNRLIWNYTRGIDSGEVIYALNYNIQEDRNETVDGVVNAEDAARLFPQGHGDAYGHYLTALKGYYSLILNPNFDWVPRIEAVNILGQPVSVDYQDERKFAAAAAAVARAGRQIFDLTWRKDFQPVHRVGWQHLGASRVNSRRTYQAGTEPRNTERFWGVDHWASRVGQGTFVNWVVGSAILPAEDVDPNHEGIQKVDRTTVPELGELAIIEAGLQTALDNADSGLSPLGIPEDGLALDIDPNAVVGGANGTHFEQIYQRAKGALNNAVASFDDAKGVTRLLRAEQDTLVELQGTVARQEHAFNVALIEIYGSPYADDMGPGKLYRQDYAGPDLIHYRYVDLPEESLPELWSFTTSSLTWDIPILDLPADWKDRQATDLNLQEVGTIRFGIDPHGFAEKPANWTGRRAVPGKIQQAISEQIMARARVQQTMDDAQSDMATLRKMIALFEADVGTYNRVRELNASLLTAEEVLEKAKFANDLFQEYQDSVKQDIQFASNASQEAIPGSFVAGLAAGGDLTSAARAAVELAGYSVVSTLDKVTLARNTVVQALELATSTARRQVEFWQIAPLERDAELRRTVFDLGNVLGDMQDRLWTINARLRELDDKERAVRALVADGDTLQTEREIYRRHAAALVQGYRTRDAAFRIFRNEKLERYKALFDLAARYTLLAANAYDYETGLLDTGPGRSFLGRIINSRALGMVRGGEPQFAGSDTGDPGLSSVLAEMKADWDVLRGRLGFNNPDAYGTTVSLRTEKFRILPSSDGDTSWQDVLHRARTPNILTDADVRRHCMQANTENGLPVPGLILTFSTTIADGVNLFGQPLAATDHAFSPSSFATKIFGLGVALEGYRGMNSPGANSGAVTGSGGTSASDPDVSFLDQSALSATPYVYLIPVGVDSMRSPPLGDAGEIRSWKVQDIAVPMPFNLGGSGQSNLGFLQSSDSLSEPLFGLRKHQAFRPVPTSDAFSQSLYTGGGGLQRSQYMNNRLIGRSVWNSQWKLVIPGRTLLNNPDEGLERFIRTVKDIRLHFVTYSYAGN